MRRLPALIILLALASPAGADEPAVKDLKVVAHLDLGGAGGPFGSVAVAGSTVVVATGACPTGQLAVVDLGDPRRPAVAATVALPEGTAAADVDIAGTVAAVALDRCGRSGAGVVLYDLTAPATPAARGEFGPPARAVSVAAQTDGPTLALVAAATAVRVVDVSDPASAAEVATWTPPGRGSCRDVRQFDRGRRALAVCGDRVYDIDLTTPSALSLAGSAPGPADRAVGLVLSDQTLALVSQEDGLRVLQLSPDEDPRQVAVLPSPGAHAAGRAVASGELAFVAWHADGLRVVDLATPGTPVVARFAPPGPEPDVVAVALLPNHVIVVDAGSGIWVVERPPEGKKDSNSDDVKVLLAALGIGGLLAFLVVPRVARVLAMAGAATVRAGARRVA